MWNLHLREKSCHLTNNLVKLNIFRTIMKIRNKKNLLLQNYIYENYKYELKQK